MCNKNDKDSESAMLASDISNLKTIFGESWINLSLRKLEEENCIHRTVEMFRWFCAGGVYMDDSGKANTVNQGLRSQNKSPSEFLLSLARERKKTWLASQG